LLRKQILNLETSDDSTNSQRESVGYLINKLSAMLLLHEYHNFVCKRGFSSSQRLLKTEQYP
jgi:hypothetical protein